MKKKINPFLEQKEERLHKDLDGDGEKGESPAHQRRVLGSKGASLSPNKAVPSLSAKVNNPMGGSTPKLPTGLNKVASQTQTPPVPKKKSFSNAKSGTKGKKSAKLPSKMCPSCMKGNAKSCSHM